MVKNDLASDRTSDHSFLANHMRLFFDSAAYVLHHALRTEVLVHTELANAQPATMILKLSKLAVRVMQYKDRTVYTCPHPVRSKNCCIELPRFCISHVRSTRFLPDLFCRRRLMQTDACVGRILHALHPSRV